MKRYPAFDPPEYVEWKPDPGLIQAFGATIAADPDRASVIAALSEEVVKHLLEFPELRDSVRAAGA